jgi:3-oxoisoapionate decarboxylase
LARAVLFGISAGAMHLSRRSFLATLAAAAATAPLSAQAKRLGIKLGYDNFAVRAIGWKGAELLKYGAELKCDTVFISDLESFGSLDDAALRELKKQADDLGVQLYAGGWSICPTSKSFRNNHGTAEEHLRLGLRVAQTVGSPVYRVILGNAQDRQTEGGIRARIADTVKVLKACKSEAVDRGVKVAVENHAGDMHSWELRDLIEDAGKDFVGANIDSGNGAWTLEDPHEVLEILGPYTICSSLRDDMIWETEDGASIAWTAAGEGLIDWKRYAARWLELCPKVPIQIETISGFSRNFPYKKEDFWKHYDRKPEALAKFEALAKRGKAIPGFKPAPGEDKKKAEQAHQRGELERSIKFLRDEIGLGLKA